MILGRTLLLGFRFSGGVPEIDRPACTSAPISSAWRWAAPPASRTRSGRRPAGLLATAIGVRRTEIVEAGQT